MDLGVERKNAAARALIDPAILEGVALIALVGVFLCAGEIVHLMDGVI